MADNKNGREKQADDEERRQRERDIAAELERGDEPEPPVESEELDDIEEELQSLNFPVTGTEVVATVGDHELETAAKTYPVAQLVPETDAETFDTPADVRALVQRPTVAAAMKQVLETSQTLLNTDIRPTQRDAYEKTFRELKAIDADDDDEGIQNIADWIVEQIETKEKLPGSRGVRRQAAKFCRANGYEIRNDEWLGV